ncbi:MAG TPA: hypothetical protein EYP98_00020 [Planctomycetes bacterium]|nr:hypothetical protein [Planctomycetota bacterium]
MRHICCLWLIALTACSAPPVSAERLAEAEPNQVARLTLAGDRVVSLAVPVDYRSLPALARTTCDAIAPKGRLLFCAREQGPRGDGYRVERGYSEPFDHYRSVLVDARGAVLERSHTLPLTKVPQHVLAPALTNGTSIESAEIVSGPVREEFWRIIAKDRRGRVFVVLVDLEGNELSRFRRNQSRVDS